MNKNFPEIDHKVIKLGNPGNFGVYNIKKNICCHDCYDEMPHPM